jgi:hypothetical protein
VNYQRLGMRGVLFDCGLAPIIPSRSWPHSRGGSGHYDLLVFAHKGLALIQQEWLKQAATNSCAVCMVATDIAEPSRSVS